MKEQFKDLKIGPERMLIIVAANRIIAEYQAAGYDLTLRGLYYKFIARDLFPDDWIDEEYNLRNHLARNTKNTIKNYKRLGETIDVGRMAGLIDWDAINDMTRELDGISTWETPQHIIGDCVKAFKIDLWSDQECRPEVWIEKDAATGVISRACKAMRLPIFSCRGFSSSPSMYEAAQRLLDYIGNGQMPFIIHIGDHDPSGIDMSRDIQDRLNLFLRGDEIKFTRVAMNMDQIEELSPPPNPAKLTDSRAKKYIEKYGDDSWELDALEPDYLNNLISEAVGEVRDMDRWNARKQIEDDMIASLAKTEKYWDRVVKFVRNEK